MIKSVVGQAGDVLLVSDNLFFSRLVRLVQRHRYPERTARWNHVALVRDASTLIEATPTGVKETPLSHYANVETLLVNLHLSDTDAARALSFASSKLNQRYGWLSIVSVCLRLLCGPDTLTFERQGTYTCSGLVGAALQQAGYRFSVNGEQLGPAELLLELEKRADASAFASRF